MYINAGCSQSCVTPVIFGGTGVSNRVQPEVGIVKIDNIYKKKLTMLTAKRVKIKNIEPVAQGILNKVHFGHTNTFNAFKTKILKR